MSYLLQILAFLANLQNVALVQDIEQCVVTNTTPSAIWQCILGKLNAAAPPSPVDAAKINAAKALAAHAKL